MNLGFANSNPRTRRPRRPVRPPAAFTMVEIALCLAVIGFALVAIIGVLPTGLQVQRENREETIINQDAQIWLSALRDGSRGYDDLTNYVEAITNVITRYDMRGQLVSGPDVYGYTRTNCTLNGSVVTPARVLTNGHNILGVLALPKYSYVPNVFAPSGYFSNHVAAYVRALSGAASEKFPQDNPAVKDLAFTYRMVCEVTPYQNWDTNWIRFDLVNTNAPDGREEFIARSNYWAVARNQYANLHEVRLLFRWPVRPGGRIGNGRQVFRATTSGLLTNDAGWYFFTPRTYVRYQ